MKTEQPTREMLVSVDVEASGPVPGLFSMLTIGACLVEHPSETFHVELQPLSEADAIEDALAVSGLSLDRLAREGLSPTEAMGTFAAWVREVSEAGQPVFVGFNAPFDWSFVNYYFQRFLGENPFGFSALDIKALYMGHVGCRWDETRSSQMPEALRPQPEEEHHALSDAKAQATSFRSIMEAVHSRSA